MDDTTAWLVPFFKETSVEIKKQKGSKPALFQNINYIDNVHSKNIVKVHSPSSTMMADVFENLGKCKNTLYGNSSYCNSFHRIGLLLGKSNYLHKYKRNSRSAILLLPIGEKVFCLLVNTITLTKRDEMEKHDGLGISVRFAKINKPLKFYIEKKTYFNQTSIYDHYSTADHIFYLQCLGIMNNDSFAFHMPRCFVTLLSAHRRYGFNESVCTMSHKDVYFWKRKCLKKLQGNHVFSQLEVRRGNKLAPPTTRRRNLLSGGVPSNPQLKSQPLNKEEGFFKVQNKNGKVQSNRTKSISEKKRAQMLSPTVSRNNSHVPQQVGIRKRRRLLSRATTKVQSKVATELEPPAMGIIMGLIQALIGAILGGLGPGGIGFGRSDVVIPYLKKHVYESVVADMTEAVATQVYEQVRPQLANHLIHTLAESVMEALQISLTHAIEHSVGNTVSVATTHGVKTMLTTMCKLNDNFYFSAISNLFQI